MKEVSQLKSQSVLGFTWIKNKELARVKKIALIPLKNHTLSLRCVECNDRGDIFDFGYLLCAICYLDKYDPRRLDRLRKNKNLTR
jgi:hypothetical protein